MSDCPLCNEKEVGVDHFVSERHKKNTSLKELANNRSLLNSTKNSIVSISCDVKSSFSAIIGNKEVKTIISAKPDEEVEFKFAITNVSCIQDVHLSFVTLVHSKFNFVLQEHRFQIGSPAQCLPPRMKLLEEISVKFSTPHIGQYETSIIFYFQKINDQGVNCHKDDIFIMKDLAVYVEQCKTEHDEFLSPYARKPVWANCLYKSTNNDRYPDVFHIPKSCKKIFANSLKVAEDAEPAEHDLAADIRQIFNVGLTKANYVKFFHNLLWYEETFIRLNIKKYNMSGVKLKKQHAIHLGTTYALLVPGLAEKRPSLMIGDKLLLRPHNQNDVMFEGVVKEINDDLAIVGELHDEFLKYYGPESLFDVRFFISRVPLERMHHAVHVIKNENQEARIFPQENKKMNSVKPIIKFFNSLVEGNLEQRCAVERIVAGTAGAAPYLLHGPPGTGKTVTVVEAILQLVAKNPRHRIMVCTDSNMAADHVATMIIKYADKITSDRLLLRANSRFRVWETLPECLAKYSNGTSHKSFVVVSIEDFMSYNIVITTLSHAAKFGRSLKTRHAAYITHLFIDEAAQASEPACLIPAAGLLRPDAALVLAGDPHQLGPVVISHSAAKLGLGLSLMERLKKTCLLYSDIRNDPNYIVMLRNNFRSNYDILDIPDKLFYKGQLRALAKEDEISNIDILGEKQHSRAIVFHGVLSKEQKVGKSPSFFNMMECEVVQLYVKRLVNVHNVQMHDIGIVTPYIRQVYQIKKVLRDVGYDKIEVGTVEAYQGKEKRIIIISTVRANCNLLDHDAKFQLGFLVDDKRFNVAITRAKAKVIIVGNPLCLEKDIKWRLYMQRCREFGTYHGFDSISVGVDGCREIVDNITPILQGARISAKTKKPRKKKAKAIEPPVPLQVIT